MALSELPWGIGLCQTQPSGLISDVGAWMVPAGSAEEGVMPALSDAGWPQADDINKMPIVKIVVTSLSDLFVNAYLVAINIRDQIIFMRVLHTKIL